MQQQGCVECKRLWPFVVMTDVHLHNFDLFSAAGAQNLLFEMSFDCFSGFSGLSTLGLQRFAALTALYLLLLF